MNFFYLTPIKRKKVSLKANRGRIHRSWRLKTRLKGRPEKRRHGVLRRQGGRFHTLEKTWTAKFLSTSIGGTVTALPLFGDNMSSFRASRLTSRATSFGVRSQLLPKQGSKCGADLLGDNINIFVIIYSSCIAVRAMIKRRVRLEITWTTKFESDPVTGILLPS